MKPCDFSPCGRYRYTLWREWGTGALPLANIANRKPADDYCMFIGLNPSTANDTEDDPTIRRCVDFAKRCGYGAMCMTNLFAWRDTKPENMKKADAPIGPENDDWLRKVSQGAGIVLAAWGNHGSHLGRDQQVRKLLVNVNPSTGQPKHPLYLKATLVPFPYVERRTP